MPLTQAYPPPRSFPRRSIPRSRHPASATSWQDTLVESMQQGKKYESCENAKLRWKFRRAPWRSRTGADAALELPFPRGRIHGFVPAAAALVLQPAVTRSRRAVVKTKFLYGSMFGELYADRAAGV